MRFDDPTGEFPRFTAYVEEIKKLKDNFIIVNAIAKNSGMSVAQARAFLASSIEPVIKVVPASVFVTGRSPFFPEVLEIGEIHVRRFEDASADKDQATYVTASGKRVFRVGVEILRALVMAKLSKTYDPLVTPSMAGLIEKTNRFEAEVYGSLTFPAGTSI